MHLEFFGLCEEPFALAPDPRFLYLSPTHFEAYSSMMRGVEEKKGVIVITGEVGTGKTLVIHALLKDLSESVKTAFVFHPGLGLKDLLREILLKLNVPVWEGEESLAPFLSAFRGYLNERLAREEIVSVVIDEAQSLDEEALEGLGRFCERDTPEGGVLQVLLVGHPELEAKLQSERLAGLKEKIQVRCRISPLDREDGRRYIEHRLRVAGRGSGEIFTPNACERIRSFARGVPRVMNLICERALQIGSKASSHEVDSKIAKEAIKEMGHLSPPGKTSFLRVLSLKRSGKNVLRVFFLLLSLGLFVFSLRKLVAVLLHH